MVKLDPTYSREKIGAREGFDGFEKGGY